ncbi:thiamine pyrophosphate-dependent enzyme [Haladaptatus sp. NG-WS-4]
MTENNSSVAADQYECTRYVAEETPETVFVSNLGFASYVLAAVTDPDRSRNFYQWGSMGVTTAVGLGLALSTDDPITVLDGDGSLLMSLGILSTVSKYNPPNLTIVLWNNDIYGTTGGQTTHSQHTDFEGVAAACGLQATAVKTDEAFREAYRDAIASDDAVLIVCHVEPVEPEARPPFDYPAISRRVRNALVQSSQVQGEELHE